MNYVRMFVFISSKLLSCLGHLGSRTVSQDLKTTTKKTVDSLEDIFNHSPLFQSFTISWTQRTYHCDRNNAYANYITCLNKWRVVRESSRGHSMFLKDVSLIDDICIMPTSPTVDEMEQCITSAVSTVCDSILIHWEGLKEFVNYLCEYREAFEGKYARCRTNLGFQSDYEKCMSSNVLELNSGKDNCRSYSELQKCLKHSLRQHCSARAAEFFRLAFHARDAPLIAYSCKEADPIVKDYVFGIQNDSGSNIKDEGRTRGKTGTDQPARSADFKDFDGNNLEVDVSNKSNTVLVNALTLYVLLLRFL